MDLQFVLLFHQFFPFTLPWPFNTSLWEEWETIYADPQNPAARQAARLFYEKHQEAMDSGAAVLWPQVEDLYTLMCLRAESGRAAFEREKQNSPLNPDLCEWPASYFHEGLWFDQWPANLRVKVLALDPSSSLAAPDVFPRAFRAHAWPLRPRAFSGTPGGPWAAAYLRGTSRSSSRAFCTGADPHR